jgi:hypothetical protein
MGETLSKYMAEKFPDWANTYVLYDWKDDGHTLGEVGAGLWNGTTDTILKTVDGTRAWLHDTFLKDNIADIHKSLPPEVLDESILTNTGNLKIFSDLTNASLEWTDPLLLGGVPLVVSSIRNAVKNIDKNRDGFFKNLFYNVPVGALKGIHEVAFPTWNYHGGDGWKRGTVETLKQVGGGAVFLTAFLSGAGIAGLSAMATTKKLWKFTDDLLHMEDRGKLHPFFNAFDPRKNYASVQADEIERKLKREDMKEEVDFLEKSKNFLEGRILKSRKIQNVRDIKTAIDEIETKKNGKLKGSRVDLAKFTDNTYERRFGVIQENWPGINAQAKYLAPLLGEGSPQREIEEALNALSGMDTKNLTSNTLANIVGKFSSIHDKFTALNSYTSPLPRAIKKITQKIVDLKLSDSGEEFTKEKAFQCIQLFYTFVYEAVPRYMKKQKISV